MNAVIDFFTLTFLLYGPPPRSYGSPMDRGKGVEYTLSAGRPIPRFTIFYFIFCCINCPTAILVIACGNRY